MRVYYGSDGCYTKLTVRKDANEHCGVQKEWNGVYFNSNMEDAKQYGRYVYAISIDESVVYDFRKKETCYNYLNYVAAAVHKETDVNVLNYLYVSDLLPGMLNGEICISTLFGKTVAGTLLQDRRFQVNVSKTWQDKLFSTLRKHDRQLVAYWFNGFDEDTGVIKRINNTLILLDRRIDTISGRINVINRTAGRLACQKIGVVSSGRSTLSCDG